MKRIMMVFMLAFVLIAAGTAMAQGGRKGKRNAAELKEGYMLTQKYCESCHISVADPEKPGKTRDTWHIVVNIMHGYGGMGMTTEEQAKVVEFLYSIRQGMEASAG